MSHALIVDDNIQNIRVLATLLSRQGINCTEFNDPLQLAANLDNLQAFDVIFLDLEMPGMDGFTVKTLLRKHLGSTPIIAYTVHVSEINVARQAGFDGFLGKPLDHTRFPGQLTRILSGDAVWERS